jgi:hypothetical protein
MGTDCKLIITKPNGEFTKHILDRLHVFDVDYESQVESYYDYSIDDTVISADTEIKYYEDTEMLAIIKECIDFHVDDEYCTNWLITARKLVWENIGCKFSIERW